MQSVYGNAVTYFWLFLLNLTDCTQLWSYIGFYLRHAFLTLAVSLGDHLYSTRFYVILLLPALSFALPPLPVSSFLPKSFLSFFNFTLIAFSGRKFS